MLKEKLYNLALVNYTNALPYIGALEKLNGDYKFNHVAATPANCVKLFNKQEVDIALLPVGAFSDIMDFKIITEFGIGCNGYVKTVKILSNIEIKNVDKIYLDNHSRTSTRLTKILLNHYWEINPLYESADLEDSKNGFETILAIGDKVIDLEKNYKYSYDLGEYWKKMTGLPFVFALWVARSNIENNAIAELNGKFQSITHDLKYFKNQEEGIKPWTHDYFTECIDYKLGFKHMEGLNKYFDFLDQDYREIIAEQNNFLTSTSY